MKYGNAPAGTVHGGKCLAQNDIFVYDFENIVEVFEGKVAIFYVYCLSPLRKINICCLVGSLDAGIEGMGLSFYLLAPDLPLIIFIRPESLVKAKTVHKDDIGKVIVCRIKALPVLVVPDGHAGRIKGPVLIIYDL